MITVTADLTQYAEEADRVVETIWNLYGRDCDIELRHFSNRDNYKFNAHVDGHDMGIWHSLSTFLNWYLESN